MTRFTSVALALILGFGSVLSAQQPGQGPIRGSLEREATRVASSLAAHDLSRDGSPALTLPADQFDKVGPGARVRITAASVVELPGLVPLEVDRALADTIPLGSILSSDDDTVTVGGAGGQVVTLLRPRHRIVGRIERIDAQTLTVGRSYGRAVTVPRAGLARLERPNGMRSRKRSAVIGLLIGVGAGGGVGWRVGSHCQPPVSEVFDENLLLYCMFEPVASSISIGILGGGVGALAGALVRPTQRWRTVPLNSW